MVLTTILELLKCRQGRQKRYDPDVVRDESADYNETSDHADCNGPLQFNNPAVSEES
jgi:hypothetical protein